MDRRRHQGSRFPLEVVLVIAGNHRQFEYWLNHNTHLRHAVRPVYVSDPDQLRGWDSSVYFICTEQYWLNECFASERGREILRYLEQRGARFHIDSDVPFHHALVRGRAIEETLRGETYRRIPAGFYPETSPMFPTIEIRENDLALCRERERIAWEAFRAEFRVPHSYLIPEEQMRTDLVEAIRQFAVRERCHAGALVAVRCELQAEFLE